ncbi:hypothetical protein C448_12776 [Halococcus morrhuae DSM 1307]|uniref:Glycosyltransferase 2-like domain-containing protein n=1 Tax=Halococcus morrhuae DSM 1307 TaxID=931277 RepID=M0M802_HALMO|nr:glycosyltransferase family 2 protein [Halococcus morrhuae]EMA40744.1 hypothetical protein C448_12776 [Halococcus morrhuae DSM 1307]
MSPWFAFAVSTVLWTVTLLFCGVGLFWLYEVLVLTRPPDDQPLEYGPDDVQVRILTIDAEDVVQRTVDSLPATLTDRHVIAEEPIAIDGAEVHVVPESFSCEAVRKGRATEWARQALACEREYVLYLDEDSIVGEFRGLPAADVVQFTERPRRTNSWLAYLADVYRMGAQIEQRAFHRLRIPLFAWGGGIAVRHSLEQEITWDRPTLVEDTAFLWQAARNTTVSYALSPDSFANQAPPSLGEIFQQRRRWAAGNHQEADNLPLRYRLLAKHRSYAWAVSPIVPFIALFAAMGGLHLVYGLILQTVSLTLGLLMVVRFILGLHHYEQLTLRSLPLIALVPLAALVHSVGATAGLVAPPDDFHVTEKATDSSSTDRADASPTPPAGRGEDAS